jgi:hypothetical protein
MSKVDDRIHAALEHNAREVEEHGPGLRHSTKTAYVAKCHTGKHVLKTGYGGLGVGSMWLSTARKDEELIELWDELPTQQCGGWPHEACK